MPSATATDLRVNPFLHIDADRIYDPLTDRSLWAGEPEYEALRRVLDGGAIDERLEQGGWLVRGDISRAHRLKIVSLETMIACNQKCYFCPVSIAPREDFDMPVALFERIAGELTAYRDTLESVFLQSYNEPTLDRRFVEFCRTLFAAKLPVAVLSNGSGLTPAKVDALIESGPLRYICINLSTLDRDRYIRDRGEDHLGAVLRNLDYVKSRPLAEVMKIVVLGKGDAEHDVDFESIRERFAGSRFTVERHVVMDRAGWLDIGLKPDAPKKQLAGCDNLGSRPLQHLHITPRGQCVLCCEDYDEKYIVGDLTRNSIAEVLAGPELAKMRKWVYGIEEAPDDFMCRDCVFARTKT
ncbi:MAG TPA: radical SAM/SPASM domain-containing protein [Thermoanaerobaculia bacterium]|jgi:MoaA/NifB/PqqE/SkfB family radical SAM enzyme|nr:radical SAM/SPASM domain-containing protein [Thermoanaerobaculia bacterium]